MTAVVYLRPAPADWGQVVANFQPQWAVTLTYNTHCVTRSEAGIAADLSKWALRVKHRLYRRALAGHAPLRYLGWIEKLATNPHVHLAVCMPVGYWQADRVREHIERQWMQPTMPNRGIRIDCIESARRWGEYIAKEEQWRCPSINRLVFSDQ